jgi:BRCA1-associated protein
MSGRERQERPAQSRIRKRPVSFGNPALGTYHGTVFTAEGGTLGQGQRNERPRPLVEGAVAVERLVAMVDVPPEQVPEGILNLARSHQPWILHVRIVIAEGKQGLLVVQPEKDARKQAKEESKEELSYTMPSSPTVSAAESAASILAAEHSLVEEVNDPRKTRTRVQQFVETMVEGETDASEPQSRSYVVLFELTDEDAAQQLVEDLHCKPYTSLDETECCSIFHVVALQGEDGVSLMSPFFAPATKSNAAGGLEIVPSVSSESGHSHTDPQQHRHRVGSQDSSGSGNASAANAARQHQPPQNEDYNCAVCLEHMDLDLHSGERPSILTTVCNHSFHMDCLLQWQDSPCPVCRYDHSGLNESLSQCHICATTEHNYVCLICGVISCCGGPSRLASSSAGMGGTTGDEDLTQCQSEDTSETSTLPSYPGLSVSHARQHYTETLHAYALDTETQHVFDFAGGGYVHRLLQNKNDGKLVEVSDPHNTTSQERSLSPGLSEAQEGEVVHRKLEGFASQYYTLLKSQLEQQRIFYEGRLEEIRQDHYSHKSATKPSDLIAALKQERQQLSRRKSSLQARCSKVNTDVAFLKSMNESLEANKAPLNLDIIQAQKEQMEARRMFEECLPPLQEKVTSLMLQLESECSQEEELDSKKPASRK